MPHRPPSGSPRGFYGVAVYHPKTEANVGSLWRVAQVYDAAFLATVGRRYRKQHSDTMKASTNVPLHHYSDIEDLIEHLPEACRVGAEDHGLPPHVLDRCHEIVQIPAPRPMSINVSTAGAIVVADRYAQHRARAEHLRSVTA